MERSSRGILLSCASLSLLLCASISGVTAQAYPKKVFDLTYNTTTGQGQSMTRMISDGQGHWRLDAGTSQGNSIMITDFTTQTMWTLVEARKLAMKLPYRPAQNEPVIDTEAARKRNATSLGVKVIDGHPCHGWRYVDGSTTTDAWIGDDIGQLVYSASQGPQGPSSMRLQSFSTAMPAKALFMIPADYKVMNMPTDFSSFVSNSPISPASTPAGGQSRSPAFDTNFSD